MKTSAKVAKTQPTWEDIDGLVDVRQESNKLSMPELLSHAESRSEALTIFMAALGIKGDVKVVRSPVGDIQFHEDKLYHYVEKADAMRERYSHFVCTTIEDPYEVWLSKYDDGSERHVFIGIYEGEHNFMVTTWHDENGDMFWNAMPVEAKKNYLNNQRIGKLKYKR